MKLTAEEVLNSKVGKLNRHQFESSDASPPFYGISPRLKRAKLSLEGDLHDDIIAYCKARGWLYVHSRMDQKTTTAVGVSDFIIFYKAFSKVSPKGWPKLALIECKRPGKKQSPAQLAWAAHALKNGFKVHVVVSMEEFVKIVGKGVAIE